MPFEYVFRTGLGTEAKELVELLLLVYVRHYDERITSFVTSCHIRIYRASSLAIFHSSVNMAMLFPALSAYWI